MEVWFLGEYQSMKHNHMDNIPSWLEAMYFRLLLYSNFLNLLVEDLKQD